jgi:small GTP-binding protein
MTEEPRSINILALGNTKVGKTSYLIRNTKNTFEIQLSTIGFNMLVKTVELKDGKKVNVKFYDTSGQERYHSLAPNFIKRADGIILMYDITDRESFDTISKWWNDILNNKEKDFPVILVGNKTDLEDKRQVQREEGENIAKEFNIKFFEVSNKDGTNVKESSKELISMTLNYNLNDIVSTCSKLSKKKMKKRKCFLSRIKC